MLLLFYYGLKYIYNFSAVCMSCIIPTRPSKPAVSVYILLFHQFIDFNSCVLNSNLSTKQDANTAITTSNIRSQSVNYANSAGSVPWADISGRPSLSSVITTVNTQTKEFTVEASTILSVNLPYTVPSGYIALGVIAVNANTASSAITRFMLNGNNVLIELRNITSGQQKITISAVVLCKIYAE